MLLFALTSISSEQAADGIYSSSTTTRYNATGGALSSTQKSLISNLSEQIESKTISINERSLTSTAEVRYTDNPMERLQTSTLPTSDTAATATVVDGFTTEQTDHLGGSWSYTRQYHSTGILSTVTEPRGNTSSTQTDLAGRPIIQTDAAGHETSTTYSSCCDQPASITDALGQTINYSYKAPDGCKGDWTESRSELCPQGESPTGWGRVNIRSRKIAEYGTAIQPATYSYDEADRMATLTLRGAAPTRSASQTAPSEVSSGLGGWALKPRPAYRVADSEISSDPTGRTDGDSTTWTYHDATGLQLSKSYADGTAESRSYDNRNRLISISPPSDKEATHSYSVFTSTLKEKKRIHQSKKCAHMRIFTET